MMRNLQGSEEIAPPKRLDEPHWAVVGNILKVEVKDLALYGTMMARDDDMPPLTMTTYGELIQVRGEYIVIAGQTFADGDVRQALSIPIGDVMAVWVLHAGDKQNEGG